MTTDIITTKTEEERRKAFFLMAAAALAAVDHSDAEALASARDLYEMAEFYYFQ